MNLTTRYLGLKLRTPLVPSASPLSENIDNIKRMEDAGAPALVFHSLFEEQVRRDHHELQFYLDQGTESYAESLTYFPDQAEFKVGPEAYLDHIAQAKAAVQIPIIGSLNGTTFGGWMKYAQQIEQAGADALELNIYNVPSDPDRSAEDIENEYLTIISSIRAQLSIPVAVKLSPFFTNFVQFARRVDRNGANALVLFNRFYQPDIELETLEISPNVLLSTPMAMRLPMRWIAMLYGRIGANLAATSGIHRATDALKMLMAGADVTMLCSVLLRRGIEHIRVLEREMREWLEEHEYESVEQLKGSMSQKNCPVLLVHPGGPFFAKKDEGGWTIPKGEAAPDEGLLTRAQVEFQEELGIRPHGNWMELGSTKQKGGKTVHAWAFEGDLPAPSNSNPTPSKWNGRRVQES